MATLKAIRKRIASVRSTQQITKAMKMVSAAKLRRAQQGAIAGRPYGEKLEALLRAVVAGAGRRGPWVGERAAGARHHLCLITADRGLCGGYNANLIRRAEDFRRGVPEGGFELTAIGRKGADYFRRRGVPIVEQHVGEALSAELAASVSRALAERFRSGATDAVSVLYSRFRSALSQVPTLEGLLPVAPVDEAEEQGSEFLAEPPAPELLAQLLPHYLEIRLLRAMLEATASEHAARMTAMDNATQNAGEMIASLTLAMNRARQASITKELMEIVSGAEALKG